MSISVRDLVTHTQWQLLPSHFAASWAIYYKTSNPVAQAFAYIEAYDWRANAFSTKFPLIVGLVLGVAGQGWALVALATLESFRNSIMAGVGMIIMLTLIGSVGGICATGASFLMDWHKSQSKTEAEKFAGDIDCLSEWLGRPFDLSIFSMEDLREVAKGVLVREASTVLEIEKDYASEKMGEMEFRAKQLPLKKVMDERFYLLKSLGLLPKSRSKNWLYKYYFAWAQEKLDEESVKKV